MIYWWQRNAFSKNVSMCIYVSLSKCRKKEREKKGKEKRKVHPFVMNEWNANGVYLSEPSLIY
jgi:hypothetical protein